ncbi:MAG: right-handed parallel beta-helix repeat-containing protein [Marinilabiliaceae bacterium]|nr:right-handed parallel beta-helix repeat-containing protein [Marinilabiliaceae bacterium]
MNRKLISFILAFMLFHLGSNAKEINLIDYGVKPWSFENASPALVKALKAAKDQKGAVIKFPGGRIDLWSEGAIEKELFISNTTENDTLSKTKRIGICLENMNDIVLEGNNTLIVLHGKMVSFALLESQNITIKNLRFDYERPTMSELTVTDVSDTMVKMQVHRDSKYTVKEESLLFYGEGWRSKAFHTILLRPHEDVMGYYSLKYLEKSKVARDGNSGLIFRGDLSNAALQPGDVLTIRDPYRDNCGAFITRSKNISLDNVKMHYMHGLGIISQFSENIALNKVEVAPRKESGRHIAAFADCFHFSGCKGFIQLDSCRTSGSHDDALNVHGTHLKIVDIMNSHQMKVRFMHHQTYGFEAFFNSDSVAFVNPKNLLVYTYGKVKNAELVSKREMILDLEQSLPKDLRVGDCLENITWTPSVTVRNCHFERMNTRGILMTTRRKVVIENNTFYRTGMHAILIANDCNFWYESGPVHDVTIRGNKFIQCGHQQGENGYVISIQPETHRFEKGKFIHSNIKIENNEFQCSSGAWLFARGVDNLHVTDNTIIHAPYEQTDKRPVLNGKLEHCKNVVMGGNDFSEFEPAKLRLHQMKKGAVKISPRGDYQIDIR